MKRVLIVSPHFPPVNAPDHQRIRMALPYFKENGWDAVVLAVDPAGVTGVQDLFLETTLPKEITVRRVKAWPERLTRCFGVRSLAARSYRALDTEGQRQLNQRRYDAVLFSTTLYPVTLLGPAWKQRFRVPYVVDFQDPWASDYDHRAKGQTPPGGWIKYRLAQWLARRGEPRVLAEAAHVISVSPDYPEQWRARYRWADRLPTTVLPFGAPEIDFEKLPQIPILQLDPAFKHWVYVGRGGDDMRPALLALFTALRRAREKDPERFNGVRLHFLGTDYAPAGTGRETVAPVALEAGVADLVEEQTARVPYGEALAWLRAADALVVPGSDDPSYTPSKIYPYVLARKPLLAIVHERSSVVPFLETTKAGRVVRFQSGEVSDSMAARVEQALLDGAMERVPALNEEAFAPFTARAMTRALCRLLDGAQFGMGRR